MMRLETMKLFAQLLEAYLPEDSSAMDLLGKNPGGKELIKKLHQEMGLAHDQEYNETKKVSFSEIKDTRYGSWVLIKGSKGTGAIKSSGRNYETVSAVEDGTIEEYSDGSAGKVYQFLKDKIGDLRSFYVSVSSGEREKKRQLRKERNKPSDLVQVNQDTLIKKFRPLWLRAMTTAEADIKGMIAIMIKNSAYEKAKKKMDQAHMLLGAIEKLETGTLKDAPDFVRQAVNIAVMMSAAHYYPAETGEIRKDYRSYTSQFDEGPRKLLKDITNGDTAKLGTIVAFFKRSLVSG